MATTSDLAAARLQQRGTTPGRKAVLLCAGLLLLALCFKAVVRGDGISYYAYLPAMVANHTDNLKPTFDEFLAAGVPAYAPILEYKLPNGLTEDTKQVGSALMALPFYVVGLAAIKAINPHADVVLDPVLQFAFTAAGLFFVLLALLLLYRFCRNLYGRWPAVLALAATVFATPLVAYLLFEPSYNHAFSVAAITIFALMLYQTGPERRLWQWLVLGAIGGVMSITHAQELLFMALVPAEALWLMWRRQWTIRFLPGYALLAIGFLAALLPQLVADRLFFQRWTPPPAPNIAFSWFHPHLLSLLVSTHHGWLSWSPLVVATFFGWPLLVRRLGWFAVALIAICLAEVWLNAALTDWWGGLGFGARRLTDQSLLLALSYAALFDWMWRRVPTAAVALVAAGIAWTVALLAQYYYIIKIDIGPPWRDFLVDQIKALRYVPHLFIQGSAIRYLATHHVLEGLLTVIGLTGIVLVAVALSSRFSVSTDQSRRFRMVDG